MKRNWLFAALKFLCSVVAVTALQFFAHWAGYGNLPGPDPRGWGDPIPFDEAVRHLPGLFVGAFLLVAVLAFFHSRGGLQRLDRRWPDIPTVTVACPNCQAPIPLRESHDVFGCPSCNEQMRFEPPGAVLGTLATALGFLIAIISGVNGLWFFWIWIFVSWTASVCLAFFHRPRLRLEPPIEFHRALP